MSASDNKNPHDDDNFIPDDENPPPRTGWTRVLWILIAMGGVISAIGTLIIVVQIARLLWLH